MGRREHGEGSVGVEGLMARFTGSHLNKVDKKGRVSVPATFRAALQAESDNGESGNEMFLRPDHINVCLEAFGERFLDEVQARIDLLDLNSEERNALETIYFSESSKVQWDPEGRIVLPRALMDFAGISEEVRFVGRGDRFHLWEPAAYAATLARHQEIAKRTPLPKTGGARPPAAGGAP